ncbi:MAG TPA: glycoside hydrolase family 2 TIM barrel-domain containing protein [Candidatus Limnocylindrales bacterium]|nr:glycoside hydrolase family 2 TIM barrel-domain containing protein [Candidatus Limnocylindrales bacterium]
MPLHPFPQLARRAWTDLRGTWAFAYDDANAGLRDEWQDQPDCFDRRIEVPFPPESRASGIGDTTEHPVVWYRRTFRRGDVAGLGRDARLLLHFGAVDYEARVWVNGQSVGRHEGGNASFVLDITTALVPGDEQAIVVRAEDRPRDLTQPRGKQFWEPTPRRIWYHRTTGIWQPVWLEGVAGTYIEEVRWTPEPARGLVRVDVRLNEEPLRPLRWRLRLSLGDDILADDSYLIQRREATREVGLEPVVLNIGRRKLLWSPRHPNIVHAHLVLEDADGTVLDEVDSYVGLRSVEATDGLFLLNGMPSYLRLVLDQGYWPDTLLAAPSDEALRAEVEAIKALGFNGVRIHQKVEDPRFLYWCDRLGLFVWSEMAAAYAFSTTAVERFTREWLEVVRRDYSHPSVVTWVPFNESWGLPNLPGDDAQRSFVRAIYNLTKALDPTRPVIGNDGWEHFVGDIFGIHDYALDASALRERYGTPEAIERTLGSRAQHHRVILEAQRAQQPIVLSEFGGLSFTPQQGTPWFGYGSVPDRDTLLARYTELVDAILDSPSIAGFCYTQLTDTEQESNGLLYADRSPKLDPAAVARVTSRPSTAIPGDIVAAAQEAGIVTSFGQGSG